MVSKVRLLTVISYSASTDGSIITDTQYESTIDDVVFNALSLGDILLVIDGSDILYLKLAYKKRVAVGSDYTIDMRFLDWSGRPLSTNPQGIYFKQATLDVDGLGGAGTTYIALQDNVDLENLYIYNGMNHAMNPFQNITPQTIRNRYIVVENRFASTYARYNTADPILPLPHQNELFSYPAP